MKTSMILLATAGAALTLAGCDEPYREQVETAPPPMEAPTAPSATDETAPVTDTAAPVAEPANPPLPADEQSSEQSVQPESETLFY